MSWPEPEPSWNRFEARVLKVDHPREDHCLVVLEAPLIARRGKPGQFVHVRVGGEGFPVLRRPLSVAAFHPDRGEIELFFRIVGRGTKWLAQRKANDLLDLLGPLGRGFPTGPGGPWLLVGGGIGSAPLLSLAQAAQRRRIPVVVLLGAKQQAELVLASRFGELDARVHVATDDGSMGVKGPVTSLLADQLKQNEPPAVVYACGPKPMLKKVKEMTRGQAFPCYLSLEERMACGVGACLGCSCAAETTGTARATTCTEGGTGCENLVQENKVTDLLPGPVGYVRVCVDGPVFEAGEVSLD